MISTQLGEFGWDPQPNNRWRINHSARAGNTWLDRYGFQSAKKARPFVIALALILVALLIRGWAASQ